MNMVLDFNNLTVEQVKLLNEISKKSVIDFNELTAGILKKTNHDIFWLTSSTISRNPYLSMLYLDFCRLDLVRYFVERSIDIHQIIVPSIELKRSINRYLEKNNNRVKVVLAKKRILRNKIISLLVPILHFFKNIYSMGLMLNARDRARIRLVPKDVPIILIDTFLYRSFLGQSSYVEKHFPGLFDHLDDKNRKSTYFVPFFVNERHLRSQSKLIQAYREKFILVHDFLKLSDYLFALFAPLRTSKISFKNFTYNGFRCEYLLKNDFHRNRFNPSSFHAILLYRFIKRLKGNDIRIKLYVDWFENQVIDRGMNKGLSSFYPKTYRVGYEGFIISFDFNIYLRPIPSERISGVIPNKIYAIGKDMVDEIKKFDDQLEVSFAPAFRYKHLFEPFNKVTSTKDVILVPLPTSHKISFYVLDLIKTLRLSSKEIDKTEFHIKLHIDLDRSKILKRLSDFPFKYKIVDGNFQKCLQEADLVICNSSTACVESVMEGIPVIIVGSMDNLLQNPIPSKVNKSLWSVCYSSEEILEAIDKFLSERKKFEENHKYAIRIKQDFFEPIEAASVQNFLQLV